MATVYKRKHRRPIPKGAEIVTQRGRAFAVWEDKKGKRKKERLADDGKGIIIESRTYYVSWTDHEGLRQVENSGTPDKSLALALTRKRETEAMERAKGLVDTETERYAKQASRPIREHVEDFRMYHEAKQDDPRYILMLDRYVSRIIADGKAKTISDLTAGSGLRTINRFRKADNLSLRTCNSYRMAIKSFTRWAWHEKRTRSDELVMLKRFNEETDRRYIRRELQVSEVQWLLATTENRTRPDHRISGPDRAMAYRLALGAGLRVKEVRSLTPESFNLDGDPPTVTVLANYSKRRRQDVQPIHPSLAKMLREWLKGRPAGKPLFATMPQRTARMFHADLEAARENWLKDAGSNKEQKRREESDFLKPRNRLGEVVDFHSTRHTYISAIVAGGASVKVAQELARHSTPVLTIGRYSHTRLRDVAGALESLPDLNSPKQPEVQLPRPDGDREGDSESTQVRDDKRDRPKN